MNGDNGIYFKALFQVILDYKKNIYCMFFFLQMYYQGLSGFYQNRNSDIQSYHNNVVKYFQSNTSSIDIYEN